jgi:hypothetical protein
MTEDEKSYWDGRMAEINGTIERILDRMSSLEKNFGNTKDFLVRDALITGRQWFDLEERVRRLEDKA